MKQNYKLKTCFLLCVLTIAFVFRSNAQVSSYPFVQSMGTYTSITGGTVLGTNTNDDNNFNALPIGFTFNYSGTNYTQFSVNNNGFIAFGGTVTSSYTAISSGGTNNIFAGFNRDIQGNGTTSELSYLTSGSAPNRTLTIQFKNYKKFGTNGTGDDYSFQIILYESTNALQVVYGTFINNANTATPQVGLRGAANTDFNNRSTATDWSATTAGGANTATCTVTTAIVPTSGLTFTWYGAPSAPPTPTEAAGPPTCSAGTTINAAGTVPNNISWYWQTSATGTSTANLYSGPYTIFANGTYYLRALNTVSNAWSTASSVAVSDFPTATPPPSPVAGANPVCVTTGTDLTVAAAPVGYTYYWQGTTVNGSSNALNAATPYHVASSGTYNVAAYETATGCWSATVGLAVSVNTYIPNAPTTSNASYNICSGTPSHMIDATPPPGGSNGSVQSSFGTNLSSFGPAVNFNLTMPAIPNGATISSAQVQFTNVNSINGSFRSEIRAALSGSYTLGATQISALASGGLISPDPVISLPGFPAAGGPVTLTLTETFDDGGATTVDATFGEVKIVVNYTLPPVSTLQWYDAATAGNQIGNTSPFETVGTTVMPNTNSAGSFVFYAESYSGGCTSTSRLPITVNVTEVLADLIPVNATCNGGDNGSFTLGAVQCGTGPFLYSLDGGVTFGPIPTDLIAGTYSVIMQDAVMGESAPITVVITEPAAPTALNATNITYFNATLGWTTTGNETSWTIIYGEAGFDPATGGTTVPGVTNPYTLSGVLDANTAYEFYVFSGCGPNPDTSAVFAFATDAGFLAWDNQCGPGFTDISTTGTLNNLTDDAEVGVTLPFTFAFEGNSYTTATIGNNGGILLGTLVGQLGFTNGAMAGAADGLYAFWDDMGGSGAGVFYQTIGTAPNQQFIVQWNREHLAVTGDSFIYQIIIDEATGEFYYVYQDVLNGNATYNYGASATIGAAGPTSDVQVSFNDPNYLMNNSCIHFYNALCPSINSVTSTIFPDEVILDWSAGLYGETQWHIVYGLEGFDPTIPAEVIDSLTYNPNSEADITNLEQNTTYEVIIYSDCAADNLMSDGFHYVFTTPPFCANPTVFAGGSDVDSLEMTWNWSAFSPDYPVSEFNFQYGMNGLPISGATATGTNNADTVFDANLLAGGVYQVYMQATCTDVVNGGTDTSAWVGPITIVMPLSNDTVCGAETLALDTTYTFNNVGATVSVDEVNIAPPATGAQTTTGWANSTLNNTTWFKFVAPASGSVRINNTAINYNGQTAVYDVADCGDFNSSFLLVNANDNEIGGTSLAPNFTICGLTPGDTYYILHDGSGTTGNYSIVITEIVLQAGTNQPLTQICTGETMDLFTTISGNDTGGVWSAPIAAANASITGSTFNSAGLGYQVFNFQYRMTDGCAYDSIVSQVQIFGLSSAGTDGVLTVCKNEPPNLYAGLNGNIDLGGQWYDISNNPTTSDQTASQFPGSFNYDYITGNGVCPDDTSNVVVTVLNSCDWASIEEAVFAGVQLYPNPTSGIINIDADNVFAIEITDANGRMINSDYNTTIGTTTIDLSKVQVGVYFVTLRNEAASKVFRVVVQ